MPRKPRTVKVDPQFHNWNPPTVCVPLIFMRGGILTIRRALAEGYGKVSLPGGFQEMGVSWQQTLTNETLEETGIQTESHRWLLRNIVSVEENRKNLLFASYHPTFAERLEWTPIEKGDETLSVDIWTPESTAAWAFPLHEQYAREYYTVNKKLEKAT